MKNTNLFDTFSVLRESMSYRMSNIDVSESGFLPADISIEPQTCWLDIHPTTRRPNKTIDPPLNNKKESPSSCASLNTMKNTNLFDTFSVLRESMSYRMSNLIESRFFVALADKKGVDPASDSELKNYFKKCDFKPQ